MTEPKVPEDSWWDKSIPRRTFLKGTAGTLAVLVAQTAFKLDLQAYRDALETGLQFFNTVEAATFEAIAARIWPGTPEDPGAREAGVVYYLDRALAGPYAQNRLAYQVGLDSIDRIAILRHDQSFRRLTEEQQDAILTQIAETTEPPPPLEGIEHAAPSPEDLAEQLFTPSLRDFFEMVRTHTMEGVFGDPVHGGNRNFAGWRVVNYPGAYYVYTVEEQQSFEPLNKPFQSVADL